MDKLNRLIKEPEPFRIGYNKNWGYALKTN